MRYRYDASKHEWANDESDWEQLVSYTKGRFKDVVVSRYHVYFTATPESFKHMLNALRIGTSAFSITVSSNNYGPSREEE